MKQIKIIYVLLAFFMIFSCSEDDLNFDGERYFTESQLQELASSSPEAALTIANGIEDGQYAFMIEYSTNNENTGGRHDDFGQKSIDLGLDLMSNDMVQVTDHWFGNYYSYRGRTQPFSTTSIIWNFYYKIINRVNSIIVQVPDDTEVADLIFVEARAKALRAYAYFNLVRIYQYTYANNPNAAGVPLYAPDMEISIPSRASVAEIYDVILQDIEDAYNNLEGYVRSGKGKIDQSVAAGLYARILLETGTDWAKCAQMANEAKSSVTLMSGAEWRDGGFDDINNPEWMWGADINAENSTIYASYFSHVGTLNPGYAGLLGVYKTIDARLYDLMSDTDLRKQAFGNAGDSYKNYKFFDETFFQGDLVFMRGAEMYLMEAEALARSGNEAGAKQVLFDLVSTRDPGYTLSSNSGAALIDEILLQRRIELWGEGFAWFDQKRNSIPLVRDYPNSNHAQFGKWNYAVNSNPFNFQIPDIEIINNEFIGENDQNPL